MTNDPKEITHTPLLPCPFCDGEAEQRMAGFHGGVSYVPVCKDCGAMANSHVRWNSRPVERKLVEALRECIQQLRVADCMEDNIVRNSNYVNAYERAQETLQKWEGN